MGLEYRQGIETIFLVLCRIEMYLSVRSTEARIPFPFYNSLSLLVSFIRQAEFRYNGVAVLISYLSCGRGKFSVDRPYAIFLKQVKPPCLFKPLDILKLSPQIILAILEFPVFPHALFPVRVYLLDYPFQDFPVFNCLSKGFYYRLPQTKPRPQAFKDAFPGLSFLVTALRQIE